MRTRHRARSDAGFTLVELLISSMIMVVVTGAIFSLMNPAQGTAAQLSAIVGIGMADFGGMPVSTTHVLSAGVAGTVVATPGETVNWETLRRIAFTWVTTLPGCMILSFALAIMFNIAFG